MSVNKKYSRTYLYRRNLRRAVGIIASVMTIIATVGTSQAASLTNASVALSDPRPSQLSSYTFTGSTVTVTPIKCIKTVFSDTSAGSTVPTGMVTTTATFDTTNSNYMPTPAGWTFGKATNGTFTLTNAGGETPASASARKLVYTGLSNGSTADTRYFMRVTTYNNTDCATAPIDNALVLFIFTNGSTLSLSVDPTLSFTVNAVAAGSTCNGSTSTGASTATTIPFGSVTPASDAVVCQDLTAATNAASGYTIYTRYLSKPTNAIGQTIADTTGTNLAPAPFPVAGNEAYGYTTADTTLGTGTPGRFVGGNWAAETTSNSEVAYEPTGVNSTTYRVGHQVGVSTTTRPGTYVTTIIYTCTPVY